MLGYTELVFAKDWSHTTIEVQFTGIQKCPLVLGHPVFLSFTINPYFAGELIQPAQFFTLILDHLSRLYYYYVINPSLYKADGWLEKRKMEFLKF